MPLSSGLKDAVWRLEAQTKFHLFSDSTTPDMLVVSFKDTVTARYLSESRAQLSVSARVEDVSGLSKRRRRAVSEILTLKFELSGTST